jgi:MFS family permease
MTTTAPAANSTSSRRWLALALIAAAQFMVIMDTSIIGVALPKMQADLGFDPQDLSWVFNAYVVAFGGLLLLGGRLSDLFGARASSPPAGSSWRGLARRGLAARRRRRATAAPLRAPVGLIARRLTCCSRCSAAATAAKALALRRAAPAGGTAGVFLGGVLTEYASGVGVLHQPAVAASCCCCDPLGHAGRTRTAARSTSPVRPPHGRLAALVFASSGPEAAGPPAAPARGIAASLCARRLRRLQADCVSR